jgi:hypothetical protein
LGLLGKQIKNKFAANRAIAWLSLASLLFVGACVSSPVSKENSRVVIGIRQLANTSPPSVYLSAYPFDPATHSAGRKFVPNGQFHLNFKTDEGQGGKVSYQTLDAVSGYYVIGHVENYYGTTNFQWVCPPVGFGVQAGTNAYAGELVFDGARFVRFERTLAGGPPPTSINGLSLVPAVPLDPKIDYSRYTNPGSMAGTPTSPCLSAGTES